MINLISNLTEFRHFFYFCSLKSCRILKMPIHPVPKAQESWRAILLGVYTAGYKQQTKFEKELQIFNNVIYYGSRFRRGSLF